MPDTADEVMRKKALREKLTEISLHVRDIVNDLVWDVDDGLRVRSDDVLNAHTVEVCVRSADGTRVWSRKDFLKQGE